MLRLGITGTDTGIGKTFIATALAAHLRQRGQRVAVMKPVETGVTEYPLDAVALRDAAGSTAPLTDICPYTFAEPLAPMTAARRAGRPVDLAVLDAAWHRLTREADVIIVEGAGGLLVPITESVGYDTLFQHWSLELVIVVENKLGALNHTLLTYRAAKQAGLPVRAIVLNTIRATDVTPATATNLDTLRTLLPGETIVSFPGHGLVQLF